MLQFKWIIFLTVLQSFAVSAQEYQLFGEGDGDQVKLYWTVDVWPEQLKGFEIKRKISETWESITGELYPATSIEDDLKSRVKEEKVRQNTISGKGKSG